MLLNSEVLRKFAKKGLSINEGIAVDARLVQSASRPDNPLWPEPTKTIYADKGYFGQPNRSFLHLNDIQDGLGPIGAYCPEGIMRKDTRTAKL